MPLVQLLGAPGGRPADDPRTYAELATAAGLAAISRYADGVGPSKDYIVPRDAAGRSLAPTSFVRDAHRAGLVVHPGAEGILSAARYTLSGGRAAARCLR